MTCGESTSNGELSPSSQGELSMHDAGYSSPPVAGLCLLLHARPSPLDQDEQHDAKKHSGNDTNKRHIVHCIASLL
jgi:hypothetical protein